MSGDEIFSQVLTELKSKTSDVEISATTITGVLRLAMEIVETTKLKGTAQKTLVEKLVRQIIVDAPISDDKEKLLLDMCDEGILGNTIDIVIAATKGELDINAVVEVAQACCINIVKRCKKK